MTKAILMLGAAIVAAGMTVSTTAAEARGLRFGLGLGVGLGLGLGAAGAMRHRRHEPTYRYRSEPRYVSPQPYKVARPTPAPVAPQAAAPVRYADGMGRVYDSASGIWHDGQSNCWAGKAPWTFKSGSWFFGSHRWYPSNGTWASNAPEPPSPIDCKASPAFAKTDQKEPGGYADQGVTADPGRAPVASVKVAPEPAKPQTTSTAGTCRKYFPNLGESLPVPCTF